MKKLPLMILPLLLVLASCQSLTPKHQEQGLTEIPSGYNFVLAGERGPWAVTDPQNATEEALYDVYLDIEDELGISISFNHVPGYDTVITSSFAGRSSGDFICLSQQYWIPLASKGFILPLNSETFTSAGLDVTDPEQVDINYTLATRELDGRNIWAMSFSGEYFVTYWGHGLAFNRTLLEAAGYRAEELYGLVQNGEWTAERFAEICRTLSMWTGKYAVDGSQITSLAAYTVSSGERFTLRNAQGKWVSNADDLGLSELVSLFSSVKNNPELTSPARTDTITVLNDFALGELAFFLADGSYFGESDSSINTVMGSNLGYLPLPVSQGESYLHSVVNLQGFCCETVNSNVTVSARIMARISSAVNDPASAEARIRKLLPDTAAAETVIKYMLPNTVFDSSRLSTEVYSLNRDMMALLFAAKEDLPGIARDNLPAIQAAIDEIFD